MSRPAYAVVLRSADKLAHVVSLHETREQARSSRSSRDDVEALPVFYREDSEIPHPGARNDVWEDGPTLWLMASL